MIGNPAPVTIIDNHAKHIQHHKALMADPIVRGNQRLMEVALNHIQEHLTHWNQADPATLLATGQQPLPQPQMPGMPPQGAPNQGIPPQGGGGEMMPPMPEQMPPDAQIPMTEQDIRLPEGMEGMPITPEENMARL